MFAAWYVTCMTDPTFLEDCDVRFCVNRRNHACVSSGHGVCRGILCACQTAANRVCWVSTEDGHAIATGAAQPKRVNTIGEKWQGRSWPLRAPTFQRIPGTSFPLASIRPGSGSIGTSGVERIGSVVHDLRWVQRRRERVRRTSQSATLACCHAGLSQLAPRTEAQRATRLKRRVKRSPFPFFRTNQYSTLIALGIDGATSSLAASKRAPPQSLVCVGYLYIRVRGPCQLSNMLLTNMRLWTTAQILLSPF